MLILKALTAGAKHGYAIAELIHRRSEDVLRAEEGAPRLKANSRSVAGDGIRTGRFPLAKALLTTQVALSLFLLVGAGLFVRTLHNLDNQPFGFNRFNVLEADLDLRLAGYKPEQLNGLYDRLLGDLNALSGIRSA